MNSQRSIFFSGSKTCYAVSGGGVPLVLIHGFGEDGRIWDSFIGPLGEKHRLIIPDIPGSGQSVMISKKDLQIDDYANCVQKILQEEGIGRCVMMGHSMGGYITLSFAERFAEQLLGFGLIHSTSLADDDMKTATRKKSIEFIRSHGSMEFLSTSLPGLFFDTEKNKTDIGNLVAKGSAFDPLALIQYQEAMITRPSRRHVLEKARVPVFFQMGVHDKAVPFESSLSQCHLPPVSEVQILRNSAHMGMLEQPDESLGGIMRFLATLAN